MATGGGRLVRGVKLGRDAAARRQLFYCQWRNSKHFKLGVYNRHALFGKRRGSGSVLMTSGSFSSSASQYVGDSGEGNFIQSGGTNSIATIYALYVGNASGSNGTYRLSGSSYLSTSGLILGNSGAGQFSQTGGTNNAGLVYLGDNTGSSGTYNLSGGYLLNQGVNVGYSGSGSFCAVWRKLTALRAVSFSAKELAVEHITSAAVLCCQPPTKISLGVASGLSPRPAVPTTLPVAFF